MISMLINARIEGDQRTWRVDGLCGLSSVDFGSDTQSCCIGPGGPPVDGNLGG